MEDRKYNLFCDLFVSWLNIWVKYLLIVGLNIKKTTNDSFNFLERCFFSPQSAISPTNFAYGYN